MKLFPPIQSSLELKLVVIYSDVKYSKQVIGNAWTSTLKPINSLLSIPELTYIEYRVDL